MKKLLIISTLFLLFVAVACDDENDVQPDDIIAQGIVENPQVTAWQYGTHILVSEDDSIMYALKSSAVNLDDYIDEEVQIYGRLIAGYPVDTGPIYVEVIKLDVLN